MNFWSALAPGTGATLSKRDAKSRFDRAVRGGRHRPDDHGDGVAVYHLPHGGETYQAILVLADSNEYVHFSMSCRHRFRPSTVPAWLEKLFDRRNEGMPHIKWKLAKGDSRWWFKTVLNVPVGEFEAASLDGALMALLEEVSQADAGLRKHGIR